MFLLIVESPGKIKKIQSFLGRDWKVAASIGHIRDLPRNQTGVYPPNFVPQYEETERGRKVVSDLKKLVSAAQEVYLATDPDREGEAIAWHLKEALELDNPPRITYTEITESAVKKALANPGVIDWNMVQAQAGRRVLDRLVGYGVSPAVTNAAGKILSAGRVQTPALRLVVEREEAIRNFRPVTHYGVEMIFPARPGDLPAAEADFSPAPDGLDSDLDADLPLAPGGKVSARGSRFEAAEPAGEAEAAGSWKAVWNPKNWLEKDQEHFQDKEAAQRIADLKKLITESYVEGESRQSPPPPFTTSTLQQAASNYLKLDPKQTMALAQKLYEAGHITYMRTDSQNMAEEALKA
ncbi:MAG: hypothetical protein LBK52_01235, partial [Deltaproteobacteria bacterium]|nr:hypothetical protein [Deltaproteobacteria bacterium]